MNRHDNCTRAICTPEKPCGAWKRQHDTLTINRRRRKPDPIISPYGPTARFLTNTPRTNPEKWRRKGEEFQSAMPEPAEPHTALVGVVEGLRSISLEAEYDFDGRTAISRCPIHTRHLLDLTVQGDRVTLFCRGGCSSQRIIQRMEQDVKAHARSIDFGKSDRAPDDLPLEEAVLAEKDRTLLSRIITANQLGKKKFRPIQWLVPDLIPEGVGMFPGAPKSGKSFIMLDLALACASGTEAFGHISVERRPVLYLALEDGERRLQTRCEGLGYDLDNLPNNLDLVTEATPDEVLPMVKKWVAQHNDGLVLVDILALATPGSPKRGESEYMFYYGVLGEYKKITHAYPGCGIVIAHHTKKAGKVGDGVADFIENALGSTALTGAVDYNLTLAFQRGATEGKLMKTGKDGADYTVALERQSSGAWHLKGEDFEEAQANVALLSPTGKGTSLSDKTKTILRMAKEGPITIEAVAQALNISRNDAGGRLRRLRDSNRLRSGANGTYVLITDGESGGLA